MYGRLAGALLIPLALLLDATRAHAALAQAWPPFVLVAGLLLIGFVAGRVEQVIAAASRLERLPGPPVVLLLACFALIAVVTALLNLDTSAVFLTPVLVNVARRRGVDPVPFLYGSVFMANASSLFLPGSNLTNLLVLSGERVSGATFFARMLGPALASHDIAAISSIAPATAPPARVRLGLGLWGTLLAGCLMVALRDAALPVLVLGLALIGARVLSGELGLRESFSWLGLPTLVGLFGLSVALGTLARASAFPADVLDSAGRVATAAIAALASVAVNNLPAAVLLSSRSHPHTGALLLGLDVGPNLAVTGSLAVLLWWRAARAVGATPSAIAYSRQGLILAPLALAGSLALGVR